MLSRRDLAAAALAGAALPATSLIAAPALAQAPAVESTLERVKRTKVIRAAALPGELPYFKKDLASGEWTGFCLAMARDIAEQLDVKLETLESTWGNSVLDLQANKIDMAFGLNPTPKRALVVDFPPAMFYNISSLVARKGFNAASWDELNKPDVRIAFDIGSSRETIVRRFAPQAKHIGYKTSPECVLSVASGRADAFACSVFLGLAARKQNPNLGDFIMPTPLVRTVTTAAIQYDSDGRFRQFLSAWIDYTRGSGQVREWILASLGDMGITPADLPKSMDF